MSSAAAKAASADEPKADAEAAFRLRAWARATLFQVGELSLHEVVDELQAAAERVGLIARRGQDEVQRVMAEAFAGVRSLNEPPIPEHCRAADADPSPSSTPQSKPSASNSGSTKKTKCKDRHSI